MSDYINIGKAAELMGVSTQTIRNWEKTQFMVPHHKTNAGTRYYSMSQINAFIGLQGCVKAENNKVTIAYCRVPSSAQKEDLAKQVENVRMYCIAKGYNFKVITDIGSDTDYTKKGLNELLNEVMSGNAERVVILYKSTLIKFGFELLEKVFNKFGTSIEIIDSTETNNN